MSNVQRIARNTAVLLISNVAGFVLGFFFTMYVARHLGAEGFGVLSFGLAFTAIFGVFTDFGLQTLMIREMSFPRNANFFQFQLRLKLQRSPLNPHG